jgi:CsoR family transcriptional regulator, copper-sensing transcriptional repressor
MNKHPSHENNLASLRRIEGQVRGIQRMIEERKYCIDILTQISAVKGALTRVEDEVLNKHLDMCVTEAMQAKSLKEKQIKIDEIKAVIRKSRKGYK